MGVREDLLNIGIDGFNAQQIFDLQVRAFTAPDKFAKAVSAPHQGADTIPDKFANATTVLYADAIAVVCADIGAYSLAHSTPFLGTNACTNCIPDSRAICDSVASAHTRAKSSSYLPAVSNPFAVTCAVAAADHLVAANIHAVACADHASLKSSYHCSNAVSHERADVGTICSANT